MDGDAVAGFQTDRISARRMEADDASYLEGLHSDAEVMATVGGVRSAADSGAWLAANLDHWGSFGFGQWMLDVGGLCVGRGGLRQIDSCVGEDLVEVGYVIGRPHWGRGYATEATTALLDVADAHDDGEVLCIIDVDNLLRSVGNGGPPLVVPNHG